MMDLGTIRAMSRDAARKAAKANQVPFIVERHDIEDWKENGVRHFPFPFLGTYVPKGWERVRRDGQPLQYFVDSSGFGDDNEPALSIPQFVNELEQGLGYAVIEAGQFQVYVGVFKKKN